MEVFIIVYEWMPGKWLGVWNKRGNCLEFSDREHAEYFLKQHPEAVHGHKYEIRVRSYIDENCLELGNKYNVWEGLE